MTAWVADRDDEGPVTLHRVMQTMIGEGLRERYEPPPRLSHELFVLMMQLKENERRERAREATAAATAERMRRSAAAAL